MIYEFIITLLFAMIFVAMPLQIAYVFFKKIVNKNSNSLEIEGIKKLN